MADPASNPILRLFVAGFEGTQVPDDVARLIRRGLGGVILFSRNLPELDASLSLMDELYAVAAGRPLMVCLDQEGGRVQRLGPPVIQLPPMGALGRHGDAELCWALGRQLGAELEALGFHLNLAPVLDVDSNPDNPIIGDRAFGRQVDEVKKYGLAFAWGLRAGGLANCVKHFPGHGDTDTDSHLTLPRLRHDMARLQEVELAPFRSALAARPLPDAVLMAHLLSETLDPERPASLSPACYRLLRDELNYEGLLLTDDLEMKAVADDPGVVEAACRAIGAGADGALICHRPELVEEAAERLTREGLAADRVRSSVDRWDRLAARVQGGQRKPDRERFEELVKGRDHLEARIQGLMT